MEPQKVHEREKVTFRHKLVYGLGQAPGAAFGGFMGSIQTFYYGWMGLNYRFIFWTQVIYAIWNVVNDPLFGHLQDKTRTTKGRYIPWIRWTAPFFTLAFIAVFFPAQTWAFKVSGESTQWILALWYLVTQLAYDTGFTIIYIAHVALAPQMTMDEKERTQIQIISTLFNIIIGGIFTFVPLIFLVDPNLQKIRIFQIFVVIVGLISFIPWPILVRTIIERKEFIPPKENQSSFWENVKHVLKNPSGRSYIFYDGISVFLFNAVFVGLPFTLEWIFGMKEEYNPGWGLVDILPYLAIPIGALIIGIFIQLKIPKPRSERGFGGDVKTALMYSLITQAIGSIISFLGVLFSTNLNYFELNLPNLAWLISIGMGITFLGFSGDMIYHNVMRADTIDFDEISTGERREAVYAGIGCIFSKPMISVALISVPFFMSLFGLVPAAPEDPTNSRLIVEMGFRNAALGVALGVFLVPAIVAIIGAIAWKFYPLDKHTLAEMRIRLEKMHKKKREERLSQNDMEIKKSE
ncbi:MAG: MFS transporter [Candidatus Lokiarchaeota archaeon]|nr:MFS transporter [Candidatus Lokiarchaeota archaeon]